MGDPIIKGFFERNKFFHFRDEFFVDTFNEKKNFKLRIFNRNLITVKTNFTFIINHDTIFTILDSLNKLILSNSNGNYGLWWRYNLPLFIDTNKILFSALEPYSCTQIITRILVNNQIGYKKMEYKCFASSQLKNSSKTLIESAGYHINYQNYVYQKILSHDKLFIIYSMHRVKNYGWPRFQIIKFYDENDKFDRINNIDEIKQILKENNQEDLIEKFKIK
jgi:hypothetical protein